MKHVYLKNLLATFVVMLFPLVAGAIDFQQDGIAYRTLTDSTVAVTSSNNVNYSGDVVIPASVTNEGVTYVVTTIANYAFDERLSLNSVTIPPTIQKIDFHAFEECNNMTVVYITDLVAWMNIDFSYAGNPLFYAHHLYLDGVEVRDLVIPDSVTTIKAYTFHGCTGFRSLFIPAFVTDISYSAFDMCGGLTSIQVEEGNTVFDSRGNCNAVIKTSKKELWIGCENTVIPSSVNTIGYCAFSGRTGITSMELHSGIYTIGNMAFDGCTGLTQINIPYNATYIGSGAFRGCTSLTQIDTKNVFTIGSCAFMDCSNLSQVVLAPNIRKLDNAVFKGCTSLVGGNGTTYDANQIYSTYARIDGEGNKPGYFTEVRYEIKDGYAINAMIHGKSFLPSSVPPSDNITAINYLDIEEKNVPSWYDSSTDTTYYYAKDVTTPGAVGRLMMNEDSSSMFYGQVNIENINIQVFDSRNVTNMKNMFGMCVKLKTVDVSHFNTSKVTNMYRMFDNCNLLTVLDVSDFDTSNVETMEGMFNACGATILDVSKFDTSKVTTMSVMFNCTGVEKLDLSNWDTSKVKDMYRMLAGCINLTTIIVSDKFITSALEVGNDSDMFGNCINLVGGKNTTYDENHTDSTYARIDGGPDSSTPGYFTLKESTD